MRNNFNKDQKIRPVLFKNGEEVSMFHIKKITNWDHIISKFNNIEGLKTIEADSMLKILRFLILYHNSSVGCINNYEVSIDKFYNLLHGGELINSNSFMAFVATTSPINVEDIDLEKVKLVNGFIEKSDLTDELLLNKKLAKIDYSRADTTNIYLGLV